MGGAREQMGGRLCCGLKPGTRRLFKRLWSKFRRRQERRDLEGAPTKRAGYKGWFD